MDISDDLWWDIKHSQGHERIAHLMILLHFKNIQVRQDTDTHETRITIVPKQKQLQRIISIKKIKRIRKYKKHK